MSSLVLSFHGTAPKLADASFGLDGPQVPIDVKEVYDTGPIVDPYWSFTHVPGELYIWDALRPLTFRTVITSNDRRSARATVRLHRSRGSAELQWQQAQSLPDLKQATEDLVEDGYEELDVSKVLFRLIGPDTTSRESYAAVESATIDVPDPGITMAVDCTTLKPGMFELDIDFDDAQQVDKKLKFQIVRRPIFSFHHPAMGPASSVPLSAKPTAIKKPLPWTGLLADNLSQALVTVWKNASVADVFLESAGKSGFELALSLAKGVRHEAGLELLKIVPEAFQGDREHEPVESGQSISLHEWTVFANVWTRIKGLKGYAHVDALRVVCVTLHAPDGKPRRTRWRVVDRDSAAIDAKDTTNVWKRYEFTSWHNPGEFSPDPNRLYSAATNPDFSRFGLPFPMLMGLDQQPAADGGYGGKE
jgi:hypothetical protein